jgi:hypothetical protein
VLIFSNRLFQAAEGALSATTTVIFRNCSSFEVIAFLRSIHKPAAMKHSIGGGCAHSWLPSERHDCVIG